MLKIKTLKKLEKLTVGVYFMVFGVVVLAIMDLSTLEYVSASTWVSSLAKLFFAGAMFVTWIITAAIWDELKKEREKMEKKEDAPKEATGNGEG